MRTKTILIIILTALFTIFLMINTDAVQFDFIFMKKDISKLVVVGVCTFIGFVLGFWVGRPKTTVTSYDKEIEQHSNTVNKSTLSDEDRDYIN
ncbi:hypothetical protein FBD94_10190 [Pedobacter hiemivivus]|uniref:LapA family protein n=2 Tax=Pedobacter hiemivivus TaxID=2530454 RepID=A0A4U1GHY3_9SPHI|nr:hypothetical protein EZ444_21325 [Pedobacter hiemivivus]TKC62570.1 hypothetical protein FBD94_10190 [Pedobacter hiemivivus]